MEAKLWIAAGSNLYSLLRASAVLALALLFPICMCAGSQSLLLASASSQVVQNTRADVDDLSRMRNAAMIQRFARHSYLVSVPSSTRSYYLHAILPRHRYARPWTKVFLERLSRQFYAKFKQRLRVTSLVRTTASQIRLARYNANAADAFGSLRSSHLTGASLDISKRSMSPEARRWMRDVLLSLRKQGYLYAIEEFAQPTFHVMVYRSYPTYVRQLTRRVHRKTTKSRLAHRRKRPSLPRKTKQQPMRAESIGASHKPDPSL